MQLPAEPPPVKRRAEPKSERPQAGAGAASVPPPLQDAVVADKQKEPIAAPLVDDDIEGEETVLPVQEAVKVIPPVSKASPVAVAPVPLAKKSPKSSTVWLASGAVVVLLGVLAGTSFWWMQGDNTPAVAMQVDEPAVRGASPATVRPAEASAADILRQSLEQDEVVLSAPAPLALEPAAINATATVVAVTPTEESGDLVVDSSIDATESSESVDVLEQPVAAPSAGRPARDSLADIRRRNEQLRRELGIQN